LLGFAPIIGLDTAGGHSGKPYKEDDNRFIQKAASQSKYNFTKWANEGTSEQFFGLY